MVNTVRGTAWHPDSSSGTPAWARWIAPVRTLLSALRHPQTRQAWTLCDSNSGPAAKSSHTQRCAVTNVSRSASWRGGRSTQANCTFPPLARQSKRQAPLLALPADACENEDGRWTVRRDDETTDGKTHWVIGGGSDILVSLSPFEHLSLSPFTLLSFLHSRHHVITFVPRRRRTSTDSCIYEVK
jgi:hypothetical protein